MRPFGYERLAFHADVSFGDLSSVESGDDAPTTAKASGTRTRAPQPQAKALGGKNVTKAVSSVTPGLLVAEESTSFAKPSTTNLPGTAPRTSPPTSTSTTVCVLAKAFPSSKLS